MKMRWLFCDDSDERLNMSVYDELAGHSAAVLGELDSEAELIVTGLYKPLLCQSMMSWRVTVPQCWER